MCTSKVPASARCPPYSYTYSYTQISPSSLCLRASSAAGVVNLRRVSFVLFVVKSPPLPLPRSACTSTCTSKVLAYAHQNHRPAARTVDGFTGRLLRARVPRPYTYSYTQISPSSLPPEQARSLCRSGSPSAFLPDKAIKLATKDENRGRGRAGPALSLRSPSQSSTRTRGSRPAAFSNVRISPAECAYSA